MKRRPAKLAASETSRRTKGNAPKAGITELIEMQTGAGTGNGNGRLAAMFIVEDVPDDRKTMWGIPAYGTGQRVRNSGRSSSARPI
jgi:hypothetical protein